MIEFLEILIDKKIIFLIKIIKKNFFNLDDSMINCDINTKYNFINYQKKLITKKIKSIFSIKKNINFSIIKEKNILKTFVIKMQDNIVIDFSIENRLKNMKKKIIYESKV